ncbi:HHL1, chloroplastic-like protein [Drosera capensis]
MEAMGVSLQLNPAAVARRLPLKSINCGLHDEMIIGGGGKSLEGGMWRRSRGLKAAGLLVVEAKGKRPPMRQQRWQMPQRPAPPPLPKLEDDGNPKFVIFVRPAEAYLWEPLTLVNGGTTAKIMVAAKDNFLGKYIYKDTLARNLAAVVYKDEKEIRRKARRQFPFLQSVKAFRYGYKLVENNNLRAALTKTSDVIDLPPKEKLKTVLDKVKDFFGEAKESFGKISALNLGTSEESEQTSAEKPK